MKFIQFLPNEYSIHGLELQENNQVKLTHYPSKFEEELEVQALQQSDQSINLVFPIVSGNFHASFNYYILSLNVDLQTQSMTNKSHIVLGLNVNNSFIEMEYVPILQLEEFEQMKVLYTPFSELMPLEQLFTNTLLSRRLDLNTFYDALSGLPPTCTNYPSWSSSGLHHVFNKQMYLFQVVCYEVNHLASLLIYALLKKMNQLVCTDVDTIRSDEPDIILYITHAQTEREPVNQIYLDLSGSSNIYTMLMNFLMILPTIAAKAKYKCLHSRNQDIHI